MARRPLIGFVGQGFIGKSYADDMERRGYSVVRYALEAPYRDNKERVRECDIVFIAVPTPTKNDVFDVSIVKAALSLVGKGKVAVIKSTILPGMTCELQAAHPRVYVMHSPEFLVARTAGKDAAKPQRNIVGIPKGTKAYRDRARQVLGVLPKAPFSLVCSAEEAELVKYAGNISLYFKVLFANLVYDVAQEIGADYEIVREALGADTRIGPSHLQVVHDSGHPGAKPGRGAGGLCFIKDVAAFKELYDGRVRNAFGSAFLQAAIEKNAHLLVSTGKDLDLLEGVHGKAFVAKHKKRVKKR